MLCNRDDQQLIALFLIILRVADRRALTSETIASGSVGSIHRMSNGGATEGDSETLPDDSHVSSVDADGETPGGLGVRASDAQNPP